MKLKEVELKIDEIDEMTAYSAADDPYTAEDEQDATESIKQLLSYMGVN